MTNIDHVTSLRNKVPAVTASFWLIKILTTGMGEAASDFLVRALGPIPAVALGGLAFAAALYAQIRSKGFGKWVYWIAVAMVSVFGTMAADILHIGLGVAYLTSTIFFAAALAAIFLLWWRVERSISIASVTSGRREYFYWATVLVTFALGTAAGDMTARTLSWGYLISAVLFTVAFAIPAVIYWRSRAHAVLLFWLAYIITRPLGASFADWIGAESSKGGLGFGFGNIAAVLTVAIVAAVPVHSKRAKF
jgi:uncharacterized membrane-anchored protein